MVQQPFAGASPQAGQALGQTHAGLAAPALGPGQPPQPHQHQQAQQAQYPAQAGLYQQQLIKSGQQFVIVSPQPQASRLNGTNGTAGPPLDSGPDELQASTQDNLYNGARPAPIYAPRPTYYGQPQVYQPARPMTQQANYYQHQQPQHSPAGLAQALQHPLVLGVRQLGPQPAHGLSPASLSPLAALGQPRHQLHQLVRSYPHQPAGELLQQQVAAHQYAAAHQDAPWGPGAHQPAEPLFQAAPAARPRQATRLSDRDSVSTLSRFNPADERRSFTVRSQYTTTNAHKPARRFGFLQLAGEALRRILGLAGQPDTGRAPLLGPAGPKHQACGQAGLAAALAGAEAGKGGQQQPAGKVTVIDSAEDYYFRRKVFQYQLVMLRLVNLVCSAFVLLSPVAMLLIPKMEPLLRAGEPAPADQPEVAQGATAGPAGVTHALGLVGRQAAGAGARAALPVQWRISDCSSSECDGPLISFVVRLIMLALAHWAIFFRAQTASLPRLDIQRCLLVSLAALLTCAYWLFFAFRVFDKRYNDFELQYVTILQFALSMLDALVLLHYLALVLLELRARKKTYCLKVVRSPDGASHYYSCGSLSIQKCAQLVLEKYHRHFRHFDAYAEQLLAYEDELARQLSRAHQRARPADEPHQAHQPAGRHSRPSSPGAHGRAGRRPGSSRRHHSSRAGEGSPARSRSLSQRQGPLQAEPARANDEQPADSSLDERRAHVKTALDTGASNSADQSSDANSRLKESSLETIRAANEPGAKPDVELAEPRQAAAGRELDTESVRSARSRRSTGRHHAKHRKERHKHPDRDQQHQERHERHHGHRERAPSCASERRRPDGNEQSINPSPPPALDPVEEHERKLRRRRLRLLAAVEDSFDQIKRLDEGKFISAPIRPDCICCPFNSISIRGPENKLKSRRPESGGTKFVASQLHRPAWRLVFVWPSWPDGGAKHHVCLVSTACAAAKD